MKVLAVGVIVLITLAIGYFSSIHSFHGDVTSAEVSKNKSIEINNPEVAKRIKTNQERKELFLERVRRTESLSHILDEIHAGNYNIDLMTEIYFSLQNKTFENAVNYILSSNLSENEKALLIKLLMNSNSFDKNIIEEISLMKGVLEDQLSTNTITDLVNSAIAVEAKKGIAKTLAYLDENIDTLSMGYGFDGYELSSEAIQKLIYRNAYYAALKNGDHYPIVHFLNNELYKDDKGAFENFFSVMDREQAMAWLNSSKELLSKEQLEAAIIGLRAVSWDTTGLTGLDAEHVKMLQQSIYSNDIDQAYNYADLLKNDPSKRPYLSEFITNLANTDFDAAQEWLNNLEDEGLRNDLYKNLYADFSKNDYENILASAINLDDNSSDKAYALSNIAIQQTQRENLRDKDLSWINDLPEGFSRTRTEMGVVLGTSRYYKDFQLELTIKDMFTNNKFDAEAAKSAVQNSSLPDSEKRRIFELIGSPD